MHIYDCVYVCEYLSTFRCVCVRVFICVECNIVI